VDDESDGDVRTAEFRLLSINARLAAALLACTRWFARVGIDDPELNALVEHLWAWLAVTTDTFNAWTSSEPALVSVGLGGDLPEDMAAICRARSIQPERLARLIRGLTEIVYGSLYGAGDDVGSLAELATVAEVVGQDGVSLPPGRIFGDSPISMRDGWGPRLQPSDVDRWRHAIW
jgi:hypothetical protein